MPSSGGFSNRRAPQYGLFPVIDAAIDGTDSGQHVVRDKRGGATGNNKRRFAWLRLYDIAESEGGGEGLKKC